MCGIAGILAEDKCIDRAAFCSRAVQLLAVRGPDGNGIVNVSPRLTFAHTRLSIIDPVGAAQPMKSGRNWITFNGEIYNYQDLSRSLGFPSKSDTEVLLRLIETKGIAALNGLDGMFAFAFYEANTGRLYIARDRFGIKPVYYVAYKNVFAFSSTMTPLMELSSSEIDTQAVFDYYTRRAARAPRTMFTDVKELEPGHVIVVDTNTNNILSLTDWRAETEQEEPYKTLDEALAALDEALQLAIKRHLVSDVPVAVFLSGGVDSSLVTALAARQNPELTAFTVGLPDDHLDESKYAVRVAKRANVNHIVRYCSDRDFESTFNGWADVVDDPVADPSAVLLNVLAKFTRDHGFKVALAGEGADEMFAGYNKYRRHAMAWRLQPLLSPLSFAPDLWEKIAPSNSTIAYYLKVFTRNPNYVGAGSIFDPSFTAKHIKIVDTNPESVSGMKKALELDIRRRLPDDLLCRTDRATMQSSIETRVPYITSYVQRVSRRMPECFLLRGLTLKYILKRYAERFVPRECLYRPKVGFDLPLGTWYRTTMREQFLDTFASTWQKRFFSPGVLDRIAKEHLSGRVNHADRIFAVLLLEDNIRLMRGRSTASNTLAKVAS